MQPLVSPVDHESRHNSYRAEDEVRPRASEATPLLQRFPQPAAGPPRDRATTAVVALLLLVLIGGVIIGIYLLVVQNESENILPPVETPLRLVSSLQWSGAAQLEESSSFAARHVLALQTDTPRCYATPQCARLLQQMQANSSQGLQYNFLVSSDGETYEALGWRRPSPMFPEYASALVLAFIGNFSSSAPSRAQMDEARDFIAESVSLGRLVPAYTLVGKTRQATPTQLFRALSKLPRWNQTLSDRY
ncbi:hypothetical protein O0L34_g2518 [Tuta absoluta]|nr:hypothetical protein O0L34_g2518 [Tuta absoluta]